MYKLTKTLEELDLDDRYAVNRVLENVYHDILFFRRKKNLRDIKNILDLLAYFVSINTTEVLQGNARRCIEAMNDLCKLCKSILDGQ